MAWVVTDFSPYASAQRGHLSGSSLLLEF